MTSDELAERVLVLAPTGRDAPLAVRALQRAGLRAEACADVVDLCRKWDRGAGAVVLAEESMAGSSLNCLIEAMAQQPAWSDLPFIVLTGGGKTTRYSERIVRILEDRGNVTLLERPIRMLTLLSAAQSALRARRRQYEVRMLLEDANRAVRQRDQFLAMLGHELRNPLAAIRTAIEIINRFGVGDRELTLEQTQVITRQSANMTKLVEDLLDVARVTTGKISLDRRPVDLRDVTASSLQAIKSPGGKQPHVIVYDPPAEPVPVHADAVRLEQVVTNLLTNAVRYTPEGGTILLSVDREHDAAVLTVKDTGDGIAADVLPRIFEPFVQSEQQLARSKGGLGIGLTVVRTLVQMHGGTVSVKSDGPGRGSEFCIHLPLSQDAPNGRPAPELAPPRSTPRRVLLVEDNPDARRTMQRLLKLWGHEVEVAADGATAVERAVVARPEVALVDIGLPDVDGYEVARRTRAALGNSIRLVALTGYGQPEDRLRAEAAGFDRHLVKPVDVEQLRQILVPEEVRHSALAP